MIKLVAGLGNPGLKYENTRHNIGFMVLDKLSEKLGIRFTRKFEGEFASYDFDTGRVYFLKPLTFMNLSGAAVASLACFYKIEPEEILVIHDEMNIGYGVIKFRHDGTAGGHNGISSIIERIGSRDFRRLKMGIGRNVALDSAAYVLGNFNPEEKETLTSFIEKGRDAVLYSVTYGVDKAMTEFNK